METGNERPFEIDYGCQSPLESIAFSSDSRLFIYADLHDMLVWDLQNEKQVSHVFMQSAISEIAVTPDQQIIIIATADGRLNFLANLESSN
jgi:WD40 repeat protein